MISVLEQPSTLFAELPASFEPLPPRPWPALIVPGEAISMEVERLSALDRAGGKRRSSEIVHPASQGQTPCVAPGLSVSINVVKPGETVVVPRDNASRIEFCIGGDGSALIGDRRFTTGKWDTWTVPSMIRREYRCDGKRPLVWLSYANTPLLARLDILYSDEREAMPRKQGLNQMDEKFIRQNAPDIPILSDGARLRGYEFLTDIEVAENPALIWPWQEVATQLASEEGDGKRGLLLLYNPATGRRNGTTHSFFATLAQMPPGAGRPVPKRGHKHSSFACNYHFKGAGSSVVDGQHFDWKAGDLMLSAPSWSEHAHGASPEGAAVLTVQDHPLQIGIESLIWQEEMDGPILTLGSEPGQTGYVGPRLAGK